jgi:hypothetical protein
MAERRNPFCSIDEKADAALFGGKGDSSFVFRSLISCYKLGLMGLMNHLFSLSSSRGEKSSSG